MLKLSPRWVCKIHTKVRGDCRIIPKFEMKSGTGNSQEWSYTTEGKNGDGNAIRTKAKVGRTHRTQQPQGKRGESYETRPDGKMCTRNTPDGERYYTGDDLKRKKCVALHRLCARTRNVHRAQ